MATNPEDHEVDADDIGAALVGTFFPDLNDPSVLYEVPESERVDSDDDDPDSVANPDGEDLSDVDPDAGEFVDLTAMSA